MAKRVSGSHVRKLSNRALAGAVGKSEAALRKWIADDRWPFGPGPWDPAIVPRVKAWAARTLAPDPAAAARRSRMPDPGLTQERQENVALKKAKRLLAQFELMKERGLYHLVDECQKRRVAQIAAVRQAIMHVPSAKQAAGGYDDVVRRLLEDALAEAINKLAS